MQRKFEDKLELAVQQPGAGKVRADKGPALVALMAVGYFVAARLGLELMVQPESVAVFWPASGLAAGVLLALGWEAVWAVVAAVFLATLATDLLARSSIEATAALSEIDRADVLLIPGGPGETQARAVPEVVEWVRAVDATTTWTTAVCTGSLVLAQAGLLDGRPATTHWGALHVLERLGAIPVEQRWFESDKYVTAAGVSAGIDMALALSARIGGDDLAQMIQLGIEYDPDPPFVGGSVRTAPEHIHAALAAGLRYAD